jgi:hypothetical protein
MLGFFFTQDRTITTNIFCREHHYFSVFGDFGPKSVHTGRLPSAEQLDQRRRLHVIGSDTCIDRRCAELTSEVQAGRRQRASTRHPQPQDRSSASHSEERKGLGTHSRALVSPSPWPASGSIAVVGVKREGADVTWHQAAAGAKLP